MDIPQLAQDAAQILAPFLPYLIAGGKEAAKAAFAKTGENFADAAWKKSEALWDKLKGRVDTEQDAVKRALQKPEEKRVIQNLESSLSLHLEDVFNEDAGLRDSVNLIIGGDVKDSIILNNSNNNRIIQADTYIEGNVYNGPAPRNPQEALKIYRDVIASTTSGLSMRGIDLRAADPKTQKEIGLANVYIDLNTTASHEVLRDATEREKKDSVNGKIAETKPLSALEAIIQNRYLIIKGDPGSGKSTFANFISHCLAVQAANRLEGWQKEDAELLPMIVILRDFARGHKKLPPQAEPRHIWDFIEKRLKDQKLSDSSKPIQKLLEDGKAIIFLDGLDEVSTAAQRIFVRDAVHAFVKRYPRNRYVVTCRILSYQPPASKEEPDLRLKDFPEFELAPFDNKKISSFIEAWYRESVRVGIVTPELADDLRGGLKTAVQRVELRKLAANPLLLTVMAVVNTNKGRLPDARALLYKDAVEILLWQWEQSNKGQEAHLRQLLLEANCADTDLEQVIWKLAYEAHAETDTNGEDEDALTGIPESKLQKSLAALNKGSLDWAVKVIDAMKLRAGLLLERDNNIFTFPHRSFQEFLAGTYLESKDDFVALAKELAKDQQVWRQVILWAVSRRVYIRGSNDGPLALVAELCPNRTPQDPQGWRTVWLAGDILLEIGLNRVERSELGKELLPRLQNRLAELVTDGHLTSRERAEAADTLARLGDPRPGVTSDYVFCEIPAGTFKMGNTEETDPTSYEDERPQFEYTIPKTYFMSRYPVTNAQFEEFIKDPQGYQNDTWWTKAGLEWRKDRKEHYRYGGAFALPNHPVVGVTWHEATAYCNWLTNQYQVSSVKCQVYDPKTHSIAEDPNLKSSIVNRQSKIRLPSEAEWERAARGGHDFRYPWKSDEITPDHANYGDTNLNATSAVGAFPKGMNDYGLLDMSGNVLEWCATEWQENYADYLKKENNKPEGDILRVLRGGAFSFDEWDVRCAYRYWRYPSDEYNLVGFRVVVAFVGIIRW